MKNLDEIRAKLKALEEGKPKSKKWKPKDEHTVRCLPLPGDEDLSFTVKWHYGVNDGRQIACPSTWGDECAFCDLAKFLRSWKDENGKDKSEATRKKDWEWFKKVDAATKHYTPIAVRKKDSTDLEGPFLWEMTPKTYQSLLKICVNDDWNEDHPEGGVLKVLTSLKHGLDVVVTLKKAGENGNKTTYDLTEVIERKKFSQLIKGDDAAAAAFAAKIPTIDDITKPVTTEEIEKVFATWKGKMNDAPVDDSTGTEVSANGETPAEGGAGVDETVARLEKLLAAKQ